MARPQRLASARVGVGKMIGAVGEVIGGVETVGDGVDEAIDEVEMVVDGVGEVIDEVETVVDELGEAIDDVKTVIDGVGEAIDDVETVVDEVGKVIAEPGAPIAGPSTSFRRAPIDGGRPAPPGAIAAAGAWRRLSVERERVQRQ